MQELKLIQLFSKQLWLGNNLTITVSISFLQSLMKSLYHAIDNNTLSDHGSKWKQRMMIALHILRLYRPIKILDPVNYGPGIHDLNIQCCAGCAQNVVFWPIIEIFLLEKEITEKKFRNIERYFIDPIRIDFYTICRFVIVIIFISTYFHTKMFT